nr:hypothetical protein [Sphingopyxis sp.]
RRWTLSARGSLILDQFGWQGARFNFTSIFTNTRVRDPLTGQARPISGEPIRNWSAEFRHDIPRTQWAWGVYVGEDLNGDNFRLDQISASRLTLPVSSAFIEYKNVLGMTVRAGIRNFLLTKDDIRREVYVDRRNGPVAFREAFIRNIYPIFTVTVSGSF